MTYEKRIAESSEESDDAIGLKVAYQLSDAENSDYKKAFAKVLEYFGDDIVESDVVLSYVNGSGAFTPNERAVMEKVTRLLEEAMFAN